MYDKSIITRVYGISAFLDTFFGIADRLEDRIQGAQNGPFKLNTKAYKTRQGS